MSLATRRSVAIVSAIALLGMVSGFASDGASSGDLLVLADAACAHLPVEAVSLSVQGHRLIGLQ